MKRWLSGWRLWMLVVLLGTMAACAAPAEAASKKAKNKAAHKLYEEKAQGIYRQYGYAYYKYADLTGDGVDEMMLEYYPGCYGSGRSFRIYTVKKGKLAAVLDDVEYGLYKVRHYAGTKALVAYGYGHGGEWYRYYRFKKGKYVLVASKSRVSKTGGGWENGPWYYSNAKGKAIKKAQLTKKTRSLLKGKKKTWKTTKWKSLG